MRVLVMLLAFVSAALLAAPAPGPAPAPGAAAGDLLVACAPGYPGTTESAQPTMDAFAAMVVEAAGWPAGSLAGEYHEQEQAGVARIRDAASLAVVPLAFFLTYEGELELHPLVQTVGPTGEATEVWSLVAAAGKATDPGALAGWEVIGIPAYAPGFVRGALLPGLPESATLTFSGRVLGALRRAAAGEQVAVLVDSAQAEALPTLPMADKLQIVARSEPVIGALIAGVGDRLDESQREQLRAGLLRVHEAPKFAEVLETLRLQRLVPLDEALLASLRAAAR